MSLTVGLSHRNTMAPVDNMMSEPNTNCNQDEIDGSCESISLQYNDEASLVESLGQLHLGIGKSTEPCQQLLNLMRQLNLDSESARKLDSVASRQREEKREAVEVKTENFRSHVKTEHPEVRTEVKTTEVPEAKTGVKVSEMKMGIRMEVPETRMRVKTEAPGRKMGVKPEVSEFKTCIKTEVPEVKRSVKKELPETKAGVKAESLKKEVTNKILSPDLKIYCLKNKPQGIWKTELRVINEKTESCNAADQLGELVARGPDRNRSRDGRHQPYNWQSSSSSSSPESIVLPSSPEGSPQSIVFDHRRQSGGSITLCRPALGNFEFPESPPPPERVQNHQRTYQHKSGGGAIQVVSPPGLPIPSNQHFLDSAHGSCYTSSPSHYSVPSPPTSSSPSHSPFPSVVPSPSQTPLPAVGSPSLYRDVHSQSSSSSFVAYSPVQESMSSPYPKSPLQSSWDVGHSSLLDQMDCFNLTGTNESLFPDILSTNFESQTVPLDVEDSSDPLPNDLAQFIYDYSGDQVAPPEIVVKRVDEIMNLQNQTSANQHFEGAQPTFVRIKQSDGISSATSSLFSSVSGSVPTASPPVQQPRVILSQTSKVPNNHPVLTSMLRNSTSDAGAPRTPVTLVVKPQEIWVPSTVNTNAAQIVPLATLVTTQVSSSPPTIGRPKTRRQSKSSLPRSNALRPIAPKPSPNAASNSSTVCPVIPNRPTSPLPTRASREELHAKLLAKYGDVERKEMNRRIQTFPDERLYKKESTSGNTVTHMAILQKQVLMSVNLIDRLVQKSPSNLKIENHMGQTLLLCAALTQQENIVEYLLLSGADPNQLVSPYGSTIVHYLSELGAGFAGVIEKVCSFSGVGVNKHNTAGRTPLLCAIESHRKEMTLDSNTTVVVNAVPTIRTLLRCGASLAVPCRCAGKTGLHVAVQKKDIALAQILCSDCPHIREVVNIQAYDGNTCLHYAAGMSEWTEQDQLNMVNLLLQHGALVTETNNESKIPADLVDRDRKEIKKLLKPPGGRRGSST